MVFDCMDFWHRRFFVCCIHPYRISVEHTVDFVLSIANFEFYFEEGGQQTKYWRRKRKLFWLRVLNELFSKIQHFSSKKPHFIQFFNVKFYQLIRSLFKTNLKWSHLFYYLASDSLNKMLRTFALIHSLTFEENGKLSRPSLSIEL